MQRQLVNDGAACSKIVLEGPDGTAWGTWSSNMANLEQSIEGILNTLREQLPKGKHGAKLISFATDGMQLSVLPLTLVGNSAEATESAQAQLQQQRANAILISNFERGYATISKMLEHNADLTVRAIDGNSRMLERLEAIENRTSQERLTELRERGKQDRLNKLLEQVAPMLEIGMGLASEYFAGWLDKQAKSREQLKSAGESQESKQLPQAESASPLACDAYRENHGSDAVQAARGVTESTHGRPEPPASLEPVDPCDSRGTTQPGKPGSDDSGRIPRNGGSASGGDRRKTQKDGGRRRSHENLRKGK